MTKTAKQIIAGAVALCAIGGGVWATVHYWDNIKTWFKGNGIQTVQPADPDDNTGDEDKLSTPQKVSAVRMAYSAVYASENTITKNISATVEPTNAVNKKVDWTITWAPECALFDEPITDYVTLEPESDGSCNCTLTFKKAFLDSNMLLSVTTRDGGFVDTCIVEYVGEPITMVVNGGNSGTVTYQNATNFGVTLSNTLKYVPDRFYDNLKIESVNVSGTVTVEDKDTAGNVVSTYDIEMTNGVNALKAWQYRGSGTAPAIVTASVNEKNIVVTWANTYTEYMGTIEYTTLPTGMSIPTKTLAHFKAVKDVYAEIAVLCGDIRYTFRVKLISTANSVSLSSHIIKV